MKGRFFLQIPILILGFYLAYNYNITLFIALICLFTVYSWIYAHFYLKNIIDKASNADDLEGLATEKVYERLNDGVSMYYIKKADEIWWDCENIYKYSKNFILMWAFLIPITGAGILSLPHIIFEYLDDKLTI